MHSVCNNTKWKELRLAMLSLPNGLRPVWRTKSINGFVFGWDGDWYYHFRMGDNIEIEWCEILADKNNTIESLLKLLAPIKLAGDVVGSTIRVYGYVDNTGDVKVLGAA